MDSAYAAGILDGEGCISIPERNGVCSVRVDVGMAVKSKPILTQLQVKYGGRVRKTRKQTGKWAEAWAWGCYGKQATDFLLDIQSHVILKQEQCRLAIALQGIIDSLPKRKNGSGIWADSTKVEAAAIRALVMEANQKGPSEHQKADWIARLVGDIWITPQRNMFSSLGWDEFSETWPRAGTMRSGRVYRRGLLEPITSETVSSLLPTPQKFDAIRCRMNHATMDSSRRHAKGGCSNLTETFGGPPNPEYVEWLMGFPQNWTSLD